MSMSIEFVYIPKQVGPPTPPLNTKQKIKAAPGPKCFFCSENRSYRTGARVIEKFLVFYPLLHYSSIFCYRYHLESKRLNIITEKITLHFFTLTLVEYLITTSQQFLLFFFIIFLYPKQLLLFSLSYH